MYTTKYFHMKKKVLFEDTISVYNRWVSGQANREFNAQRVKYSDLFGNGDVKEKQQPNNSRAENVMPYPIPGAVSALGDLLTNYSNTIDLFKTALKNPNVQKDKKAKQELEQIISVLRKSLNNVQEIFAILDKNVDNDDQ